MGLSKTVQVLAFLLAQRDGAERARSVDRARGASRLVDRQDRYGTARSRFAFRLTGCVPWMRRVMPASIFSAHVAR